MAALKKTSILLALMFMVLAFTSTANAQQALGTITCTVTATSPLVRAEGVAEAAGDIKATCTNTPGASITVAQYLATNVTVLFTNVNVTNSIGLVTGAPGAAAVANATEAVVVINENNSATPLDASIVPSTVALDARFPGPQYGRLLGTNLLEWLEVQFPVPGAPNDDDDDLLGLGGCDFFTETGPALDIGCFPATTTLVIQNIRVNVSGLASPAQVAAIVSITGPTGASFTSNEVKIGLPLVGLITEVAADEDGTGLLCTTDDRHPIITLTEGFATSFKTIGVPTFSPINTQVESGYFSPAAPALALSLVARPKGRASRYGS